MPTKPTSKRPTRRSHQRPVTTSGRRSRQAAGEPDVVPQASERDADEEVTQAEDEPDMQFSRIPLSDKTSRLHPRHVVPEPTQAYEPEVPVEVREWIGPAPALPDLVLGTQSRIARSRVTRLCGCAGTEGLGCDLPNVSSLGRVARRARVGRIKERLATSRDWVSGDKLADGYARQRGSVTTAERAELYREACRGIFRALLSDEFRCERQYPHIVHKDGVVRFGRDQAEFARGVWWGGQRDHADDPVLSAQLLRQYIRDLWLPAARAAVWLEGTKMQFPPWWLMASAQAIATGKPKPDVPRRDYRAADAPLVAEMRSMIVEGRAKNPTDAARAVAHKACGDAKADSKVVRLVRHYGRLES